MQKILQRILMFVTLGGLFNAAAAQGGVTTGQSTWTGTVSQKGGSYFLTQEGTNTTVELRGSGLAKHAGHRVQLKWTALPEQAPAMGASQVVLVDQVNPVGAAAASSGAKAAGTVAKSGLSKAAFVAAGTGATGATVGSLYAADVIGGDDQPASRP